MTLTADPPRATLDTPGSVRVSALLMQDAVTATPPDVTVWTNGAIDRRVALYANPFLNGQEEALVINGDSHLTYLRRAATETGWDQTLIKAPAEHGHHSADRDSGDPAPILAGEVVVVVHPRDQSLWAICSTPVNTPGPPPRALRLVADTADGLTACRWEVVADAISYPADGPAQEFGKMSVTYDASRWFCISALGGAADQRRIFAVSPLMDGPHQFLCSGYPVPTTGKVDELTARYPRTPSTMASGAVSMPTFYLRSGPNLYWYDSATKTVETAYSQTGRIVGTFPAPASGNVGCLMLDPAGTLIAVYPTTFSGFQLSVTQDVVFSTAMSWIDADGMVHVYGLDAANLLKVVHQRSWGRSGAPVWAVSTGVIPPSKEPVTVTSCVGLAPGVSAFALDPFPDAFPSQLVRVGDWFAEHREFAFHTQDVNSARWSRDKVRLPVKADPHLVTSYVATATVLDRRGVAMPGLPVRVSAETLAEVRIDGVSYLVGPGSAAVVSTNAQGKVVIAMPADSLAPAVLHVDAAGLRNGAVIQPAAAVHSYLGGSGTLPSQQGTFTPDALKAAKVGGVPIVLPGHDDGAQAVVDGARQAFLLADGKTPMSRLTPAGGPAAPIHGFVVGPRPGAKPNAHGVIVPEYQEFATAEAYADYHRRVHGASIELGSWQDVVNWAGDVWQGIKNGAIAIYDVAVNVITGIAEIAINIGKVTVKLAALVLDTAETAARAVESMFRQVVADVGKVVDWLASLFDFEDIWETKTALTKGTRKVLSYGLATVKHFQISSDKWVADQLDAANTYYGQLRDDYANRPLGDARNQLPLMTDASGGTLAPAAIRDDPRSGWLTQQAVSPAALAAFRASAARAGTGSGSGAGSGTGSGTGSAQGAATPVEVPAMLGTIASAWDDFLRDVVNTKVVEEATKLIGDLDALVASISNPADPAGTSKASMIALINVLQSLTALGLTTVQGLFTATTTLVETVVGGLDSLFSDPVPGLGYLETLYEWIQGEAGVDTAAVEKPSLGSLLMLMAAFPVTVGYKLVNGVGEGPFPDGEFPELLAPSWHADYDAERTAAAGSDPVLNRHLRNLQIACGVAGLGSAGPGVVADLLPLMDIPKDTQFLIDLITGVDTTALGAFMFGAIGSCPPVTGTDWNAAGGKWAVAFEVAVITVVANIATIAKAIWDYLTPNTDAHTSIMRNVQLEMAGPVITTFLALAYLIPSGQACMDEQAPVNPYTTAMILLSGISGATQICRLGLGSKTTADAVRGGVVAGINFLATGVSASMLTAGAILSRPVIDHLQLLPRGNVGKPYEAQVKATGGDHVFNQPLKDWSVIAGALPPGLTLDAATGVIKGTPTQAVGSRFTVQCSDSYGPPQFSNAAELWIGIG